MFILLFIVTFVLTQSQVSSIQHWLQNLQFSQLHAALPSNKISVIRICDKYNYAYYGLDNGQIAISKFGYESPNGHYFEKPLYIKAVDTKKKAIILDILPIYGECMIVCYKSENKINAIFIESNYSQNMAQMDVNIHPLIIDSINPITMHYNQQSDQMLIFYYNQQQITRLQIKNMKRSKVKTKEINLNIPLNIKSDDQLHVFCANAHDQNSYILSTNNIIYAMNKNYKFEQLNIDFSSSTNTNADTLKPIFSYSPSIGLLTASTIWNPHNNESFHVNWIEDTLAEHGIYTKSIEAAQMIQVGMDLGVLLVINDPKIMKNKGLFYLGGSVQNELESNTNSRRLLMAKGPSTKQYRSSNMRSKTHIAGHNSVKPEPVQCHSKKLYVGFECFINGKSYNVIKKLGSGADGDVFLSKSLSNDADVALKQFKDQRAFNSEVKILSMLQKCAYSTHMIDSFPPSSSSNEYIPSSSSTSIIVMEFVSGGDLSKFMQSGHKSVEHELPIAILRRFLMDLSEPLSILNSNHNYMHTDVKPENILVSLGIEYSDNEPNIDFILADMSVSMSYDQFHRGHYAGTAKWFSPEMSAAAYKGVHRLKSKECIDGYGLALVGIHLYLSLCSPKGHMDPLCVLANKYKQYLSVFEADYRRGNKLRAYERLFEMRSTATRKAKEELNKMASHSQASIGYKRADKLLNAVSAFLIRSPVSNEEYPYLLSGPSFCVSWGRFKRQVMDSKFVK